MGLLRGLKDLTINRLPMEGWAGPPPSSLTLGGTPWGGISSSGESASWDAAMAIGVVYACVALLGGVVGGMPLITYRKKGKVTERAEDRPEYDLLHDAPMPEMTSLIWRETAMGHQLLWGNCYSEIIRDRYLGLTGIKLLPPHRVQPRIVGGKRQYDYTQPDGSMLHLTPKEVLHIPGLGYDGFVGYSVLHLMREDVGLYRAAHSFGSNFFRNNARPAMVLQHPKTLPEAVQLRLAAQMDRLRGSANAGKTVVLEDDMKFQEIGIPPEDAQFMDTRRFQIGELSRWFGTPPHMVGDVSGSTSWGSGIAEQSLGFLRFTADRWLNRWEAQIKLQIFGGYPELRAEFLRESLLKADAAKRFAAYKVAIDSGWMSRAEVRERENLNPVKDLDKMVLPANIAPIDKPPAPPPVIVAPGGAPAPGGPQDGAPANGNGNGKMPPQLAAAMAARAGGKYIPLSEAGDYVDFEVKYSPDQPDPAAVEQQRPDQIAEDHLAAVLDGDPRAPETPDEGASDPQPKGPENA